jgi:arylsulfatase A-like enzyme/Flp pilus assembly protein TadD
MKKKKEIAAAVLFLLVMASPVFMTAAKSASYNFLLITIDTLRADRLSCYDDRFADTPNIDALAAKGLIFTRAFAHTPTTLPSHASILTGATPLYHGIHENSQFILTEKYLTLAEHVSSAGYSTGAFVGAFPLDSRFGLNQGFDVYDDNYGSHGTQTFAYVERRAEIVVERALEWLRRQSGPWFLWIHVYDPHQRYDPPEPFKSRYPGRHYEGEVAYTDHSLGKVFDYLDEAGMFGRTLIALTSDHGEALGDHGEKTHGYFAYNATLHVPLILVSPDIKPGRTAEYACHSDIFPTVCAILGLDTPGEVQGVSLVPAARGKELPERLIYFESLYPYYSRDWAPLRGLFSGKHKFIDLPITELYDLKLDFNEMNNISSKEKNGAYAKSLHEYIQKNSAPEENPRTRKADPDVLRKLRSLGYLGGGSGGSRRKSCTADDDLKTLLPFQAKLMDSMRAYDRADYAAAERLLMEIKAQRKDLTQAYAYLSEVYKQKGDMESAVAVLEEGCRNNPGHYQLLQSLGITLVEAGKSSRAIVMLEQGLDIVDYDPELWNYLGVAHWHLGRYEEAEAAYEKALQRDANYPVVYNNLGALYLSRALKHKSSQDLRKAIENYTHAIELDPEYAEAYNGLGTAWGQAGRLKEAVSCWEKALFLEPIRPDSLFNLGLAYRAIGERNKALDYLLRYKNTHFHHLAPDEQKKLEELLTELQR